jgi:putative aldouronate transport system permease protein
MTTRELAGSRQTRPGAGPIQRVLQSYLLAGQAPHTSGATAGVTMPPTEAIKMAVVVLTVAPIVAVYPFIQRHFIKGVLIGAVKG